MRSIEVLYSDGSSKKHQIIRGGDYMAYQRGLELCKEPNVAKVYIDDADGNLDDILIPGKA